MPVQPKPGPKHWTTWRRLLGNTFLLTVPSRCTPRTKNLDIKPQFRTTDWSPTSSWLRSAWSYSRSPSTNRVYHYDSQRHLYTVHEPARRSRRRLTIYRSEPHDVTHQPPTDAVPIDAIANQDTIQYTKNEMQITPPDTPPADTTPTSPD